MENWHGDPNIFLSSDFKKRCEKIVSSTGLDSLVFYLFIFEHAGKQASVTSEGAPIQVQLPPGEEERFFEDLEDQNRLREIAATILSNNPSY